MEYKGKAHLLFVTSLFLKGLFALAETISGIITYLISFLDGPFNHFALQHFLFTALQAIIREELTEDPRDFIANYFLQLAQNLSLSALHFAGLYLLTHGIIKLWLVIGLLRKKLWYYPAAMTIFGFFILYQLYRYSFTHSLFLLLITGIDLIVIGLTWHEYQYLREKLQ